MNLRKSRRKIDEEILYFPTYRRIEEDMSNLGIDIEKDRVKSRLIQFGMTDVEKHRNAFANNKVGCNYRIR